MYEKISLPNRQLIVLFHAIIEFVEFIFKI